jgi:ABC-type bacteriocin/lantibiotic exporter with double-glycine peptidase domain
MIGRRVPLVVQGSEVECAPACLAMIATYHGHHLSLRESRELCATGRDGATAAALTRAARGLGLTVKAYRPAPGILPGIPLPAIAHWGRDHFVVVERARRTRIDVLDPGRGRRRIPAGEFDAGVGRVLLTAQPGPGFQPRHASAAPFWRRYLATLMRMPGTRLPLAQLLGVSAVIQLLGLALPALVLLVIDKVIPAKANSVLLLLGIGIGIVVAAQLITGYLRSALIIYLQGRLDTQAMISFCAHLMRLPLGYFQRRSTGDILLRTGSIAMLRELLSAQTLTAVLDLLMIALYLAVMAVADLSVALIVLAVIAAQVTLLALTLAPARDRMSAELAAQAKAYGQMTESVEGITTLKASAAEHRAFDQWSRLFLSWMRATLRRSHLSALIDTISGALRTLTPLAVLWLAATRVLAGSLSLGAAMALTWLAAAIVLPLSVLAANGQRLQLAGAQLHRLADVLDTPPEHPSPQAPASQDRQPHLSGRLELQQVSFRYDSYSPPVLRDITLTIEPGTRVAIVGASGAGKTTLALLILGLYQPTSGTICLDGTNLATLDPHTVRAQIGTVLQDPFVFSGTIGDNIAFQDPAITPAGIEHAARLASLHDDISALPQGYNTRLAERGGGLSGGQRQRLAIARALVRQPALLLLDEATSHLDAVTEAVIHRNLAGLACTQILIAHRLSTIRDAGLILVLHDGHLAEHGTHTSLLAHGGRYAALVAAQLDGHNGTASAARLPTSDGATPAPTSQPDNTPGRR